MLRSSLHLQWSCVRFVLPAVGVSFAHKAGRSASGTHSDVAEFKIFLVVELEPAGTERVSNVLARVCDL